MRHERLFATVASNVQFLKDFCLGRLWDRLAREIRRLGILGSFQCPNALLVEVILVRKQLAAIHAPNGNDHLLLS